MSDGLITARARIAQKMTEVIESDRRVRRCKRIDFVGEGGALIGVELVPDSDAKSRDVIARELELPFAKQCRHCAGRGFRSTG